VLVVGDAIQSSFEQNAGQGYHLIVGAKGGKLQLVLNTVYHLSSPVENIPYPFYKEFLTAEQRGDGRAGKFSPWIAKVVPVCMGDYYQGHRVIGTTPAIFFEKADGTPYEFEEGENFKPDDYWGAVIGSVAARNTGLTVGSELSPTHGADDGHVHEEKFHVTGVLAPTGTPADRAVYINMEGFYLLEGHAKPVAEGEDAHTHAEGEEHEHEKDHEHLHEQEHGAKDAEAGHDHDHEHGHDHHHHEPLPESQREVTALLVRAQNDLFVPGMRNTINEGQVAQAVSPVLEIENLFAVMVDPIRIVLLVLTVLIVVVSAISILVSMYNSMSERKHEIAIMRALGAQRNTVMLIVLLESIFLAVGGGLIGWLLGHSLIGLLNPWIVAHTGVSLGFLKFVQLELFLIPALVALASLVGYLPALAAYRTDVAQALTANP